ncbi:fibropellin-3-like [Patiria miniata]|uniref:EGF-like domain-containing protein n=1 Tax=Patiria miniata TaxID=46514 RepID=A0A913ZMV8_PATMI|nr:fibropellin-3-like [Patiria miniata]
MNDYILFLTDDPCESNPCWNEGSCVNSSADFSCICAPGFIGLFCESQSHPLDLVFVTDLIPPGIYVAPTDTFNFTLIPGLDGSHVNIRQPRAINYDPLERMVYWTDYDGTFSTLNRAFLNGSGVEVLFMDLQGKPIWHFVCLCWPSLCLSD